MKKLLAILTMLTLLSLPFGSGLLAAPCEMSDAEMDAVSGGNAPTIDPSQEAAAPAADTGLTINSSSIDNSLHTITLSGQAQQNLTAMVNFIAVNSPVQVMLNLNVSINSNIGSVNQSSIGTQSSTQTAIVP